MIFSGCFFIFFKFPFFGLLGREGRGGGGEVKAHKIAQDNQKNMSVAVDISGTIYHVIVIYGTLVSNDDVCSVLFSFFQNFNSLGC